MWNPLAVARLPQFQVAIYSLLLLASILAYGFQRTATYLPLPIWRRKSIRPSILDLLNLLRDQIFARRMQDQSDAEYRRLRGFGPRGRERAETPAGIGDALHRRGLAYARLCVYPQKWPISRWGGPVPQTPWDLSLFFSRMDVFALLHTAPPYNGEA